jgi:hypothetical protein
MIVNRDERAFPAIGEVVDALQSGLGIERFSAPL